MESSWVKSCVASNMPGYMPMPRLLTVKNVRPDIFEAAEDWRENAIKVKTVGNAFTSGTESLVPSGIREPKSVFLDGVVISYMDVPPPSYYEKYVTMGVPGHIMSALELARDTHGWCCLENYRKLNCHELEWDPSKVRQSGGYTWIDVNLEGRLWPFVICESGLGGTVLKHVIKNLGFFMSNVGSSVECKVHCFLRFRHIYNHSYTSERIAGARRTEHCMYRWALELDPIRVYVTRSCLHAEQVFERVDIKECMGTSTDVLRHLDIGRCD